MKNTSKLSEFQVVNDFLISRNYIEDEAVEGIILYGSYQTKTNTKYSDIDILILYKDNNRQEIKGYETVKNTEVEYYERTLKSIRFRIKNDYQNSEDTLLSAIGHGEILFDRNGKIKKLQRFALQVFEKHLPSLETNEILYLAKSLEKRIKKLQSYVETDSLYFTVFYSLTLEKIRTFYHRLNGYSSLTTACVYKIYTDKNLQKLQYKTMPEDKFIKLYLNCLDVNNLSKENSLRKIKKLFAYSIRDLNINFKSMRINIKNKNH